MAIETFIWPTERGDSPEITYRVRTAQFGDGYKQEAGDGPNNKEDSYPISHVGPKAGVKEIMDFFDRHRGRKRSFGRRHWASSACSPARTPCPLRWAAAFSSSPPRSSVHSIHKGQPCR